LTHCQNRLAQFKGQMLGTAAVLRPFGPSHHGQHPAPVCSQAAGDGNLRSPELSGELMPQSIGTDAGLNGHLRYFAFSI
jgi:hypothetical protein